MRRLDIFIIILAVAVTVLVTLAAVSWYYAATAPSYYGSSWMGQIWGEMGGSGEGGIMGNGGYYPSAPSYLWVLPVTLIAIAVTAVLGVGFYLAYPELKYIGRKPCSPQNPGKDSNPINDMAASTSNDSKESMNSLISANSCEMLLKTMTSDEQKVISVLINHKGKHLQKYVVKESGLSRLKTHRVIARFAQRGIVSVKEFGNTNEIALADWIQTTNSSHD